MGYKGRTREAFYLSLILHLAAFVWIWVRKTAPPAPFLLVFSAFQLFLVLFSMRRLTPGFYLFFMLAGSFLNLTERIGLRQGNIFGEYSIPGPVDAPAFISSLVMLELARIVAAGLAMAALHERLLVNQAATAARFPKGMLMLSMLFDGAFLLVALAWVSEPLVSYLGYRQWAEGSIPNAFYWAWWAIGAFMMYLFSLIPFDKTNRFAIDFILIHFMFFLLLRFILHI